jgi:hypothetical protein
MFANAEDVQKKPLLLVEWLLYTSILPRTGFFLFEQVMKQRLVLKVYDLGTAPFVNR